MKEFKLNIWKTHCDYCVQILEQPDDYRSRVEFKSSTGYTIVSAGSPEYRQFTKEIFIQGMCDYLDNAVLHIPEEDFSVFMRSLEEFCERLEWRFEYEVERNFGNL